MELKHYIWNIYEIAKANNAQTDVARDMFIANLNQKANRYKGADLDYVTLGQLWQSMNTNAQHHEKVEFNRIVKEYFAPLSKAWQAKDKKAFDAVIAQVKD